MGYYIDHENMSKEDWLEENSKACSQSVAASADFSENFPVILADNGVFTAAGIAFDKREFEAFTLPEDRRPKKFFIATREKLIPYCKALATD